MPTYVYRCPNDHRLELTHKMSEDPVVVCERCDQPMKRVPQRPAAIAFSAQEILQEWMDENYRRWRTKRRRFSPDVVKRPGKPIPAKDVRTR